MRGTAVFQIFLMLVLWVGGSSVLVHAEAGNLPPVSVLAEDPEIPTETVGSLEWMTGKVGFNWAVKLQKENELPFVVYFYNAACELQCEEFRNLVLFNTEFSDYLKKFSRVMVNGDEDEKLIYRFGVDVFPSFLILTSSASARKVLLPEEIEDYVPEKILATLQASGLKAPESE